MTRVALVSGGNRGIGRAVGEGLAEAGLTVVAGARDPDSASVADGIELQQLDVTDQASVDAAVAAVGDRHGRLDVLVNSAGILSWDEPPATDADFDVMHSILEVNLFGAWRLTKAALPLLRAAPEGRIVSLTSGMGSLNDMGGGSPGYRVSKTALNAMTRIFAAELGD